MEPSDNSMEDRKQLIARNVFQWVGIPLMLALVGFFFIGPSIGGQQKERTPEAQPEQEAPPVVAVREDPEESEDWVQPSPPQVNPSMIDPDDEEETEDDGELDEDDLPIPPPMNFDGNDGDEAGIGGLLPPPVKDDSDDDKGDDSDDGDDG